MSRTSRLIPLLFLSGACSLIYQGAWLRDFRLIFGASTLASAAVTAIFMGGLGLGSWWIGRKVDRSRSPLALYGNLELLVAGSAALTPALLAVVRATYIWIGGSPRLGDLGASVLRLVLSAFVLGVPTLAMGATLPAVIAASVTPGKDDQRTVGALYGVNTLGAVSGTLLGTFVLIEVYGVHRTLWLAALVNALVGLTARYLARSWPQETAVRQAAAAEERVEEGAGTSLVLVAAAVVGFVFFLMEMVWYRLLSPILGGSTFTFGLILALALLGIGLGGLLHSFGRTRDRGQITALAVTCLLEALFLALPFVVADDLAVVAALLRPLGVFGLAGLASGWALVMAVVILPAAIIAGYQFPLIISLLRGRSTGIGNAVGLGYAANTLGSIAGALLGGFGLLHLLSAPGTWRLGVLLLCLLGGCLALLGSRSGSLIRSVVLGASAAAIASMMVATGPTSVWRHSSIGAGRADLADMLPNQLEAWKRREWFHLLWETDGLESSVALYRSNDLAFLVNGKSDGAAVGDSGTQVMGGLLGAMAHPAPKRALVIGLGTGSTAGWLADVPGMERVDVIEIEPAIVEVARRSAPVNRNVLENPRVHLVLGDAREVLQASSDTYDIIFSEPSNPYRIGVASLFSREFYQAANARLRPGGVFLQWVQAYEIFPETLRTAMATLASVFPEVETWQTIGVDLVFVASALPRTYDVETLRSRAAVEPYKSALRKAWRVEGVEGYLAYFVAGSSLARAVANEEEGAINTDDEPLLEYGFARSVGHHNALSLSALRNSAHLVGAERPKTVGVVDWERVDQLRLELAAFDRRRWKPPAAGAPERTARLHRFFVAWANGAWQQAGSELKTIARDLSGPIELRAATEVLVRLHSPDAAEMNERLRRYKPMQAGVFDAVGTFQGGDLPRAAEQLLAVLKQARDGDPWEVEDVVSFAAPLGLKIVKKDPTRAAAVIAAFSQPFSLFRGESSRRAVLASLAEVAPSECVSALAPLEPHPEWSERQLSRRLHCYQEAHSPLAEVAQRDMVDFLVKETGDFRLRSPPPQLEPGLSSNTPRP